MDAVLALMLTGLVLTPLITLADPQVWTRTNPVPLLWALLLVLMTLGLQGVTPGKRWLKLRLEGQGCLICRELRRLGWALALGLEALLYGLVAAPLTSALLALGVILLAVQIVWPVLTRAPEFPHNRATDLQVTRAG